MSEQVFFQAMAFGEWFVAFCPPCVSNYENRGHFDLQMSSDTSHKTLHSPYQTLSSWHINSDWWKIHMPTLRPLSLLAVLTSICGQLKRWPHHTVSLTGGKKVKTGNRKRNVHTGRIKNKLTQRSSLRSSPPWRHRRTDPSGCYTWAPVHHHNWLLLNWSGSQIMDFTTNFKLYCKF